MLRENVFNLFFQKVVGAELDSHASVSSTTKAIRKSSRKYWNEAQWP